MIVIVDYGMGNIASIKNMLRKIGAEATLSSDPDEILQADKLILPGVGSFDYGMEQLSKRGLIKVLNQKVIDQKTPLLGICLGMQLLTQSSEEGTLKGLGWIDAHTKKFKFDDKLELRVPHMGWNQVVFDEKNILFKDMYDQAKFYFVHSYYVECKSEKNVGALTTYGYDFACSIIKDNIIGVQFHPEKSHKYGMKLFKNFVELI